MAELVGLLSLLKSLTSASIIIYKTAQRIRKYDANLRDTAMELEEMSQGITSALEGITELAEKGSVDADVLKKLTFKFSALQVPLESAQMEVAILESKLTRKSAFWKLWAKAPVAIFDPSEALKAILRKLQATYNMCNLNLILAISIAINVNTSGIRASKIPPVMTLIRMMAAREKEKQHVLRGIDENLLGTTSDMAELKDNPSLRLTGASSADPQYRECILDRREGRGLQGYDAVIAETNRLANLLSSDTALEHSASHSHGLLRCLGYTYRKEKGSVVYLIFELPTSHDPHPSTLATLLKDTRGPQHSLNQRLKFATSVAQAVFVLHSSHLVHKNIRPESILVTYQRNVPDEETFPHVLGTPYLVAFGLARSTAVKSKKLNDFCQDLYHHPTMQLAVDVRGDFGIHDDIYSLGVCLLEIGLWRYFPKHPSDSMLFLSDGELMTAMKIKDQLITMAEKKLPPIMGDSYSEVVVKCLRSRDAKNGLGAAPTDALIGFKDEVLGRLHGIAL